MLQHWAFEVSPTSILTNDGAHFAFYGTTPNALYLYISDGPFVRSLEGSSWGAKLSAQLDDSADPWPCGADISGLASDRRRGLRTGGRCGARAQCGAARGHRRTSPPGPRRGATGIMIARVPYRSGRSRESSEARPWDADIAPSCCFPLASGSIQTRARGDPTLRRRATVDPRPPRTLVNSYTGWSKHGPTLHAGFD
jgi:hypothetical protein